MTLSHRSLQARFPLFLAVLVGLCVAWPAAVRSDEAAQADDASKKTPTPSERAAALERDVTQGALRIEQKDGTLVECPLKHTDVQADISGFIARVNVTQTFENPTNEKIEAVYVFPLPNEAAVDSMRMVIGERRIVGLIKRRDAARRIYEQALAAGQTAALLEQERPNIFTQSVGNIEPGQEIKIEISYVDVLKYDMGTYEFHFPMVVGPRFNPGSPTSSPQPTPPELQDKVSPPVPNTTRVPDASRISPPVLKPGVRNGHDISLAVSLDAGVPIQAVQVANHRARVETQGKRRATIKLAPSDSLPNKDFVVRYDVMGKKPELAVLAHTGKYTDTGRLGEGYFMLMIQPREDEKLKKSPPREIVFLVDVSGSMSGQPTAKVRDAMDAMLKLCREKDTVQVVTFASQARQLFEKPVPVNNQNIKRALGFTRSLQGSGGTRMLQGVKLAIDQPIDKERVRIVVMLTDGYIGNEAEIIEHVGKNCGDQIRFWAIGMGSSPNMFLVDGVAKQGGGMGKRLGLDDDTQALTHEVMTRIQRAQLAKIKIDWGNLDVAETYPAQIPELWAGRPVILFGRYSGGGNSDLKISGVVEGEPTQWTVAVDLPAQQAGHDVLAKVWARRKIEDLMHQTYYQGSPAVEEEVTALALDYQLMSQYTSFVAVDEAKKGELTEPARPPRRMLVPVPLPAGTRYEGFIGQPYSDDADVLAGASVRFKQLARNTVTRANIRGAAASSFFSGPSPAAPVTSRRRSLSTLTQQLAQKRLPNQLARQQYGVNGVNGRFEKTATRYYRSLGKLSEMQRSSGLARGAIGGLGGGGGFGWGGMPASPKVKYVAGHRLMLDGLEDLQTTADHRATGYAFQLLGENAAPLSAAAAEALKQGDQHREKKDLDAAAAAYARAYFLDAAAANVGGSNGTTSGAALARIVELRAGRIESWKKQLAALDKRLDLVIRDASISEALTAISKAAGVEIKLTPGSTDDARRLLMREPRVRFLDLRRATLAEALDWTLQPANLDWQLSDDQLVVASQRRRSDESTWVYDASLIAVPTAAELGDFKDHDKALQASKAAADEFITALRTDLGADEKSVVWFSSGQVLVIGNAQTHDKAARLLDALATSKQPPAGETGKLHAKLRKRLEAREKQLAERNKLHRQLDVAAVLDEFGWRLLAAAAGGTLDSEALTELQIAWSSDSNQALLKGSGAAIALKSLWQIQASADALPDAKELAQLAEAARQQARPAADAALAALRAKPDESDAFVRSFYAALAFRHDNAFVQAAIPLLITSPKQSGKSELTSARVLSAALLGPEEAIDREELTKIVLAGPTGNDMVALVAMACRRAGGEVWETFRAESRDLLGGQPLSGSVVVLIHRLPGAGLPLFASR